MRLQNVLRLWCALAAVLLALTARTFAQTKSGRPHTLRLVYGFLAPLSMLGQLVCLWLDGTLSPLTALPLHICGFSGLLCPAAALNRAGAARFLRRLGAPCALVALLFPAMLLTSRPVLSGICFFLLHALILFSPVAFDGQPDGKKAALVLAGVLLTLAVCADLGFGANYLFLRAIPQGTPFTFLTALPFSLRAALLGIVMLAALIPDAHKKPMRDAHKKRRLL